MNAIEILQLTRVFGERVAVEDLTLAIPAGSVFGFLGPNGAGKTTTVRMLAALIAPSRGSARIAGHTLGKENAEIRRTVGILTETPGLYDRLSAWQNLLFFARLYGLDGQQAAGQVERYLRMLELWERRNERVGGFSKGMRQKLAIARALLHEPQVVFLDEPTAGLDPQSRRMLWDIVLKLREQGKTILITTHYMDEAQILCDRIAIMDGGQIIALDSSAGLINRLGAQATIDCRLDGKATSSDIRELPGVTGVRHANERFMVYTTEMQPTLEALLTYAAQRSIPMTDLQVRTPTLEDVFLDLTGREFRPE